MAEHGKDIQHAPGTNPSSAISPATVYSSSSVNKSAPKSEASVSQKSGSGAVVNVTTINDSTEFRADAANLYQTFTDPQRIAAFTRAPPKFAGAKPGAAFELFGGNVSGEYVELQEPTHIVQKWRLAQWPAGHYSTLSIWFDQNDIDAVTVMRVEWKGVPVGQEEPTKTNWDQYYIRSIKQTFGFGSIL